MSSTRLSSTLAPAPEWVAGVMPPGNRYLWLDNDARKLRGLLIKAIDCYAVIGDGGSPPVAQRSMDWTTMIEVSHHLPYPVLRASFEEIARVTRGSFVFSFFMDFAYATSEQAPVEVSPRTVPAIRGGTPVGATERSFELVKVDRFRVNHYHLLCVASPCHAGARNPSHTRQAHDVVISASVSGLAVPVLATGARHRRRLAPPVSVVLSTASPTWSPSTISANTTRPGKRCTRTGSSIRTSPSSSSLRRRSCGASRMPR